MAGDVQGGGGTVGYVELDYALQPGLPYAAVENSSGAFVAPNGTSVAADAAAFPNVTADNYLIVNGSGAGAYPISTYSWVIVYQKQANTNNGIALGKLLHWMATDRPGRLVGHRLRGPAGQHPGAGQSPPS